MADEAQLLAVRTAEIRASPSATAVEDVSRSVTVPAEASEDVVMEDKAGETVAAADDVSMVDASSIVADDPMGLDPAASETAKDTVWPSGSGTGLVLL